MQQSIKITTWNINSVRLRLPLIGNIVREINPDILCLQETKVEDDKFPVLELASYGFEHVIFSGQKSYNGVAILSRMPLHDVEVIDVLDNGEKRHISAMIRHNGEDIRIHNFYVPAGGDVPDVDENPKFRDKLEFVDRLCEWSSKGRELAGGCGNAEHHSIILGDFNIAPLENDVWSHKQLLKVVSHTPIEVEKLTNLRRVGEWIDTARYFVPEGEKLYSWWSYRNRDWKKSNRGRRLDHIWVSPSLEGSLLGVETSVHARDWEKPSDHVPVTLEIS